MSDKHQCDNCQEEWDEDRLELPRKLHERVDPGGTMPSGECPECGALCYPMEKPFKVWMDWGDSQRESVEMFEFHSNLELNAFLEGVNAAGAAWKIDDYRQFDSEAEVREAFEECD